jgi:hypothetical protein
VAYVAFRANRSLLRPCCFSFRRLVRRFLPVCVHVLAIEIRDGPMGSDHSASATLFEVRMTSIFEQRPACPLARSLRTFV